MRIVWKLIVQRPEGHSKPRHRRTVLASDLQMVLQVSDVHPRALQAVLLDLPGLLFLTTYTLLVLFWAEIYHQVSAVASLSSSAS